MIKTLAALNAALEAAEAATIQAGAEYEIAKRDYNAARAATAAVTKA